MGIHCLVCKRPLVGFRSDRLTCCGRCRVKLHRSKKKVNRVFKDRNKLARKGSNASQF